MIKDILKVINSGLEYLTLLRKTSHIRRMRKAVDYGETFIRLYERLVLENDEKERQRLKTRMSFISRKFFKHNQ